MKPEEAFIELLDRLGANKGAAVFVNDDELHQWPSETVKALQSQELLVRAHPASSAVCPGCEQSCVMSVHTASAEKNNTASFIVCDKRSDINRVIIPPGSLTQWQCNVEFVCGFIASCLGLRSPSRQTDSISLWEIGIVSGDKRSQMLCLEVSDTLDLVVGHSKYPLAEFIGFHNRVYALDAKQIRQLVDSSTSADKRYTPSNVRREARKLKTQDRDRTLQKAYRDVKKENPGMSDTWYSLKIFKMGIAPDLSPETIRKKMKKR